MIRLIFCLLLSPLVAYAQSSTVLPSELEISVTVENADVVPYQGEMILITIHGIYRRHITLEKLANPSLEGFNWMQLGEDHWFDSQERGIKVKNFRRRMALFPEAAGDLTIGPFVHNLTLTDEGDDWFEHQITSDPVTIRVEPTPVPEDEWWFPVRQLRISDQWSNAPDQLKAGEGVLRVIRVEAIGVSPEMIPPMPDLHSPSAMIFPHPEKRLVELSPVGPVAVAFWRWTIRPTNDTSAILEPLSFSFFDTQTREHHEVTISAQRVAMEASTLPPPEPVPEPARLRSGFLAIVMMLAGFVGLGSLLWGRRIVGLVKIPYFDPLRRGLRRAARENDLRALRRWAAALARLEPGDGRLALLSELDDVLFRPGAPPIDMHAFVRRFLKGDRRSPKT